MLQKLFQPRSIAVIGASRTKGKLGNVIVHNLLQYDYRGTVYPVNPKGGRLYKRKVYTAVTAIPRAVDLAVIVIPAQFVADALRECGKKNIRAAIIVSAGFSEQDQAGAAREKEIVDIAKKNNIRILGPNCLGIITPHLRMNASFAAGMPERGPVAVVSQSGAMAVAITEWALSKDLGFSALVSLGNKADVHEEEVIRYLSRDQRTKVIIAYLESLAAGRSLLRTIKKVSAKKPIIILKPGKSKQAQHAVTSHTGAIAGAHAVQQSFLESAGAIVVDSLQELFLYTKLFEEQYRISGGSVAVVTNAGGPGILATDAVAAADNLTMARLQKKTITTLEKKLPEAAATGNPVDVVGDADTARYRHALHAVLRDPGVDGVVALLTHQYVTDSDAIARAIVRLQKQYPRKPISVSFIGGEAVASGRRYMTDHGILQFNYPEQAVNALSVLHRYLSHRKQPRSFADVPTPDQRAGETILLGKPAERLLNKYVPHIIPSRIVTNHSAAIAAAKKIGYPVVAKIVSQQMVHKTESQAVKTNIADAVTLRRVITRWQSQLKLDFGQDEGFMIQPYRPGIVEMIIGAKRDPHLGPYLVVGVGGIFVEAIGARTIIPIPATKKILRQALQQGLLGRILRSNRGRRIPQRAIVDIMAGMAQMMQSRPEIQECDCNPVMLHTDGVSVVDVRIVRQQ